MSKKPFLSIDDILGKETRSAVQCTKLIPRPSLVVKETRVRRCTPDISQTRLANNQQRCALCSPMCHRTSVIQKPINPVWYRYYAAYANHQLLQHHWLRQPRKRIRASFSHEQVLALQKVFDDNKYVGSGERRNLARRLRMTEQQVKIWFQNRRYKEKRNVKKSPYNEATTSQVNHQNEAAMLGDYDNLQHTYSDPLGRDFEEEFQVFPISDNDDCFDLIE